MNYIKNEFISELQNNKRIYLPNLYTNINLREKLKKNVDASLLQKYKFRTENNQKQKNL